MQTNMNEPFCGVRLNNFIAWRQTALFTQQTTTAGAGDYA